MTTQTAYNSYDFVSPCCKAFIYYNNVYLYCSCCNKEITKLEEGQDLTISIKFNSTIQNNMSADILNAFYNKVARFSTDPTCEICSEKCEKCGEFMRYLRDPHGNIIYVCSNHKCRNVQKL